MTRSTSSIPGTLYIVATPIGNRDDLSIRAINVLKMVDVILSEDSRHSKPLLTYLGINKPLLSFHAHNEHEICDNIINELLNGKSLALISDAGTPSISDPGYLLVHKARLKQILVVPIPGACALITALSAAGIPSDVFSFFGFLPAKSVARRTKLTEVSLMTHTLIFYESTHRIIECLQDLKEVFGATCQIVIAKELTKQFERFISGTVTEVYNWLQQESVYVKGEFVILIPPRMVENNHDDSLHLLKVLLAELPLKQAVKIAAKLTSTAKNVLYTQALELIKF